jgi:hypothetical protein
MAGQNIGISSYTFLTSLKTGLRSQKRHRFANLSPLLPERHDGFAWAGRPGKKLLLSVYVCVGLAAAKLDRAKTGLWLNYL